MTAALRLLSVFVFFLFAVSAHAEALVDANEASEDTLASVPGLSDDAAKVIISGRPFASIGALHAALSESMSGAELDALYGELFIPIDLNSASREDILLIPGVERRMAHEFEEYRPYSSIEQFRREIGKYVDEEEVARLERYVRLD